MQHQFDHAVVIGGSLAGLCAARVLSDHFQRVTVLERDRLPESVDSRPGVPQDRHVHVLLRRGALIMGQLFPGIEDELVAAGAHRVDLLADSRLKLRGHWAPRFDSDKITYACSRILLESILRSRVMALDNVDVRGRALAQGLYVDNERMDGERVTGVQVIERDGEGDSQSAPEIVEADFVVDASGRSSKTPLWLDELGYGSPSETVVDVRLGYAGRRYQAPADPTIDWKLMLVGQSPPDQSRSGLIYSEEDDIWMVMLAGILADYPPTEAVGFDDFARSIDPEFYAAIQKATPISDIFGYRKTENRFRHYEKLARWPDRFVVVGDAVCGFNPVYGQGMTVATMAAEGLDETLAQANGTLDGLALRFQQQYPKLVEPAWMLATSADIEWLGSQGRPTPVERVTNWYVPKVLNALTEDRLVYETFIDVQSLVEPPIVLFRPGVFVRVMRHWLSTVLS